MIKLFYISKYTTVGDRRDSSKILSGLLESLLLSSKVENPLMDIVFVHVFNGEEESLTKREPKKRHILLAPL